MSMRACPRSRLTSSTASDRRDAPATRSGHSAQTHQDCPYGAGASREAICPPSGRRTRTTGWPRRRRSPGCGGRTRRPDAPRGARSPRRRILGAARRRGRPSIALPFPLSGTACPDWGARLEAAAVRLVADVARWGCGKGNCNTSREGRPAARLAHGERVLGTPALGRDRAVPPPGSCRARRSGGRPMPHRARGAAPRCSCASW